MNPLKFQPGQKFFVGSLSASQLNAAFAAGAAQVATTNGKATPQATQIDTAYKAPTVRVANLTGGHLNQYSIVGIDGPGRAPDDDEASFADGVVLRGVVPDAATHLGLFAVLLQSADAGEAVPAAVSGIVPVYLDHGGIASGAGAEIVNGEVGHLRRLAHGSATVVWSASSSLSAPSLALVRLGQFPSMFPVQTHSVDGTQGDEDTEAVWYYDIKDMDGRLLASHVDPTQLPHRVTRQGWGATNQGQFGFATMINGQLVILETGEVWEPTIHPDARVLVGTLRNSGT